MTDAPEMEPAALEAAHKAFERYGQAVDDETYEIGKRDGYEDAIQDLDLATGGDGEFRGSTIPGETVDVPAMKRRIIERFSATPQKPENTDWPVGKLFSFADEPGGHDPCYVVMPDGCMLPVNHHAGEGVDIARAKFIVAACNAALAVPAPTGAEPAADNASRYHLTEPTVTINGRTFGKGWLLISEAEYARMAPSGAEPVAWTGSGSIASIEAGLEGYIWPEHADAHPIPLYASPQPVAPTGEIAGLVERLERARTDFWAHTRMDCLREAATALASLSAERDRAKMLVEVYSEEQQKQLADWKAEKARATAASSEAAALRVKLEEYRKALEPFALVADRDIGDDEADTDRFQPMRTPYNRAPLLTVGDLRRARALASGGTDGH